MKMNSLPLLALLLAVAAHAADRPKITGIDHVDFYTTSPEAQLYKLYMRVLGFGSSNPVEPGQTLRFTTGSQFVGYSPAPDSSSGDRMDHVAFRTDDCEALLGYLARKGFKVPHSLATIEYGRRSFRMKDPEGHAIEFVEWAHAPGTTVVAPPAGISGAIAPISTHMIHAGFIVHDRAVEDHFYKDILGFHLYWQGGMKPDKTEWAAMQVPDGTDWLEYMLNVEPNTDQHTMGVMNHISLGVRDIKEAQAKLESHGWKPHGDEKAQMGRDGKWQLNLYDPDFTRIELMEFKPRQKPCCSEFHGQHPSD